MGKVQKALDEGLKSFVGEQKMFFVATAPLAEDGMVNTSPKGYRSFAIINDSTVAYLDYPGSGNETARHVMENGRLTIMFCSFEERPLIVRLLGKGEVIEKEDERFYLYEPYFQERFGPWTRQIIVLHIDKVKSSCGESVPFYEYKGERESLHDWAVDMNAKGRLGEYIAKHR
jgi:hypothetical protein